MNVLVTGALGHVGSRLIRQYARRDEVDRIRLLDNFASQRYPSLFDLPDSAVFEVIEGDVRDPGVMARAMEGIDIVVHLAAITDAPSTIDRRDETFEVNYEGTRTVAQAAVEFDVERFLFPSTTSVYGEAEGWVDEGFEDLKPATPYAEAKLKSEDLLKTMAAQDGLPAIVMRMGTIFGTSPGMRFHTVVNKFCYQAALGIPLTVWEDALDQYRPYLDLTDDIAAFEFLESGGEVGELYNVLTDNYTVRDLVDAIEKFVDVDVEIVESPLINQKSYRVADDKLRAEGFAPSGTLEEGVLETLNLFASIDNSDYRR